jgi:aryl-alcohol dehydrogenase-like predicted oxidoreductase
MTRRSYREEEREMNKYCNFAGIGIIPWGPLNSGFLARPVNYTNGSDRTARDKDAVQTKWQASREAWEIEIANRVQKVAADKGWTMSQVALAWINGKVTSPIIGFSSVCLNPILRCLSVQVLTFFLFLRLLGSKKLLYRGMS